MAQGYTKAKLNEMKKADLIEALMSLQESGSDKADPPVLAAINDLRKDICSMRDEFHEQLLGVKKDLTQELNQTINDKEKGLKKDIDDLKTVISQQQLFLEKLDQRTRERNLVITGVSETDLLEDADGDHAKVALIFAALDVDPGVFSVKRIGIPKPDRVRPMLIIVDSYSRREEIMKAAPKLDQNALFENIRIKRDTHPATRKEWKRLFDAEKREKAKPENAGCTISFDRKKRRIMRDDVVIDSWKPLSFL